LGHPVYDGHDFKAKKGCVYPVITILNNCRKADMIEEGDQLSQRTVLILRYGIRNEMLAHTILLKRCVYIDMEETG
jgi:hypothetical protein